MRLWHPSRWRISDLAYPLLLIITWLVSDHVFFWDTIQLGAKHATWFYDQQFSTLLLPESIDSGHPPLFGWYLGLCWFAFGQSLTVSHFAMLPFLWGVVAALQGLHKHWYPDRPDWPILLWIFVDPLFATQSILISPDILIWCGLLWTIWGWYRGSGQFQAVGVMLLGLTSMRGMMVALGLFLFQCAVSIARRRFGLRRFLYMLLPYLPGGLLAAAYLYWHYTQTGWFGYHPDSPWAPSFARVDGSGFVRNLLVLGWRMVDHGRIIWWVFAGICFFRIANAFRRDLAIEFLILTIALSLTLLPSMLLHQHLLAHRYLLPIFLGMHLLAYRWWQLESPRWRKGLLILVVAGFLSGNFWIYPTHLSQGWDSTLAHVSWYALRQKTMRQVESMDISPERVGTHFPMVGPFHYRDLRGDYRGFAPLDWETSQYVLVSNLHNEFTESDMERLRSGEWEPVWSDRQGGIWVDLYQRSSAAPKPHGR